MRYSSSFAVILVYLGLVAGCDREGSGNKTEAPEKTDNAVDLKSATPVDVDAAGLAAMYAPGSKNTKLQRDAKEEEIKGKVVEWKGLELQDVEKDGEECFRLETSATHTHPAAFVTACKADDPAVSQLAPTLETDDRIDVRGVVDGISMGHIELKPATVTRVRVDEVTEICEKMAEIAKKERDIPEEVKNEMADIAKCKVEVAKEKAKDPEKFAKMADCAMTADDMRGFMECAMKISDE